MKARRVLAGSVAGALLFGALAAFPQLVSTAWADGESHAVNAQGELTFVRREMGGVEAAVSRSKAEKQSAEQRLANGELLYRTKDYSRAIVVLSEILEEFPNTPSYPDALWLRGETYYAAHEYLAARRDYKMLVNSGDKPRFQSYFGKSLARLVDVALRLNDPPESLQEIFDKFGQVPPAQVDAGLLYAKGKAQYRRQDLSGAQQSFASVAAGTPYTHQARYFQGLVAMKIARAAVPPSPSPAPARGTTSANYKQAIETFRQATILPADSPDHKHVIDLSWMAVGRLFYEMEQYQQASEAYAKVGRDSPEFDTMLYELAWVYVRLGDVQRAERALEVLAISDPGSPYIGDGTLLRADLLLRAGAFDLQCRAGHCAPGALQLYEDVLKRYSPMLKSVTEFLSPEKNPNHDVSIYYDKLSQQQLDALDQNEQLPALAIRWAREAEDGPAAFAVIDDINQCKTLMRQSNQLVERLTALTGAANRVKAFPELLAGEEAALALINRVSRSRLEIARGLDDEEPGTLGGEVGTARARRRELMAMMVQLPTNQAEFSAREQAGMRQWNVVSQDLSRTALQVDQLQAVVNGLRRMLKEDPQRGVARDPASVERLQKELEANERDLKKYREQISELRRVIEIGRAQIGLGDARYQNDAQARLDFRAALEREVELVAQGQAGGDAQRFGARISPLVSQAHTMEDKLVAAFAALEVQVEARAKELREKIETERNNLARFQVQLDALDTEAKDLVGRVAERNFGLVREKLKGIVLRADVGITEQAWEVREEENARVSNLMSERARQEQLLDEELKEVRDDGAEPSKEGAEKK